MATEIRQKPLYTFLPVGQQIIFTVENTDAVDNYFNVKYIAELHINTHAINLSTSDNLIASFKTTPNNAGVGIFDFQNLLEGYVSSQNTGVGLIGSRSKYKGVNYTLQTPHPIHVIDKFARGINNVRNFAIQFKVEGSSTATAPVSIISGSAKNSEQYAFFNGVLQRENYLTLGKINAAGSLVAGDDYGYDLESNLLFLSSSTANSKFLTNSPTTQYANVDDYGTFAFLNFLPDASLVSSNPNVYKYRVKQFNLTFYKNDGTTATTTIAQSWSHGGATNADNGSSFLYFGCFPANLRNTNATFQGLVTDGKIQGGYYTIQAENEDGTLGQIYTINVNCPNAKDYESIRLAWLNQWGAWDYYTFTMKSVRSTSTNRTTYTQMQGTWNDSRYRIDGFKGGRKNFRVNSTERISVNTDFVTEADAVWFEELINSQDVYIIKGFDASESAPYNTITNKYVEPVLVTTSSYTRKTIANDKLMQYTFELERNKTQKTQPA
jgi:hypothetical protein